MLTLVICNHNCIGVAYQRRAAIWTILWMNFVNRHVWDKVVILEESNLTHSQCPFCGMFIPRMNLNVRHPGTTICSKGAKSKFHRLALEEDWAGTDTAFWA